MLSLVPAGDRNIKKNVQEYTNWKKTNKTNDKKGEINSPLNKNAGIPPNKR